MRYLLLVATALAMLAGPAMAQPGWTSSGSGASSSTSKSNAVSSTKSSSVATANPTMTTDVYVGSGGTAPPSAASGTAGNGSAASDPSVHYSGGYTVRNTPEVIPPNVAGGNTCAVGAAGGLSLSGFGIAAGGTWADKACERRQEAALLYNMGRQKAAYEMMCQDDSVRAAMKSAGEPCVADLPPAKVSQAPGPAPTVAVAPAGHSTVIVSVAGEPAGRGGRAG